MIASISSATLLGVDGHGVHVEVQVANGLPGFSIVGLPDAACREARDRVRAALLSSGSSWPSKRITVNLAPSGLRKVGTGLDLAIAVAVLVAAEQVPAAAVADMAFIGELGLDGSVRPVAGIVPLVDALDAESVVVPRNCAAQAQLVGRHKVLCVENLAQLTAALAGDEPWPSVPPVDVHHEPPARLDLADVKGQPLARWALEVAAAGGHNLLMVGPPGSGKTMLAKRLPGLLPDLDNHSALTVTRVHSAAGTLLAENGLVSRPPLRAPHHSASVVSMIGGGTSMMRPGEISLAHGGVLFLDELCEFPRSVLESLRQPLEEGEVRISRSSATVTFPANFQLIAAANPCPCGEGFEALSCRCTPSAQMRYRSKISGPLLDRFDLRIRVNRPSSEQFLAPDDVDTSSTAFERVCRARQVALGRGVACNAQLQPSYLRGLPMTNAARELLIRRLENAELTGRGLDRIRRVAQTIADLAHHDGPLEELHVSSALSLHCQPLGGQK